MPTRLKLACRTNETQVVHVLMFTIINLIAVSSRPSLVGTVLAALFWPTLAFIGNLIDPIPRQD